MEENKKPQDLLSAILDFSKKGTALEEIREKLGISNDEIFSIVEQLREKQGYDIQMEEERLVLKKEAETEHTIRLEPDGKKEIKILLISDTRLGLKTQQGDLLSTAYKIAEKEKVNFAIHIGNVVAGRPTPKTRRDFFLKGDDSRKKNKTEKSSFDKQLEYLIEHYPEVSFKTYFVAGWSDLTFKEAEGRDIIKSFCAARKEKNFFYCGDHKAIFVRQGAIIEVLHAKAGPEPYTKSYEIQGIGGKNEENIKLVFHDQANTTEADIIVLGGRHVGLNIPVHNPRKEGVKSQSLIMIPSLAEETPSEKVKNILAGARTLGFKILTLHFFPDGSLENTTEEWYDLTAYQKENCYLNSKDIDPLKESLYEAEEKIVKLQEKSGEAKEAEIAQEKAKAKKLEEEINLLTELIPMPRKLGHLARKLTSCGNQKEEEAAKEIVKAIIERLRKKGYKITEEKHEGTIFWERTFKKAFKPVSLEIVEKRKIAFKSDDHLCNKGSRVDLLKKQYEIAEEEKCDAVADAGDVFDGSKAYDEQEYDLNIHGADAQREYGLKIWPVSNIPTFFISGSAGHESKYWRMIGHNIVKTFVDNLQTKRRNGKKLYFYTDDPSGIVGVFEVGNMKIMLRHPTGGAPKARSYRPQEIVNRILSEIKKGTPNDVHAVGLGHLHIALFMLFKGMAVYMIPCIEEISGYLQGKTLIPDLGMWVSEIGTDKNGNVVYVKNKYFAFESSKAPVKKIK